MMNDHYAQCRTLPTINETFPQFNRPISLISPLDLSLRASNVIPITPPSTPSPPRKRQRLMSDENYLWRPHVMGATSATLPPATATTVAQSTAAGGNYFHNMTYVCRRDDELHSPHLEYKNNLHDIRNKFEEIPESQSSAQQPIQPQQSGNDNMLPTIYVDDETIVLTEDEDETLVSSHDYMTEDADDDDDEDEDEVVVGDYDDMGEVGRNVNDSNQNEEEDDEEEYVDILSNDDDEMNILSVNSMTIRLQGQAVEEELEKSGKVLTRNKLVYDNEELHNQAIDGLEKLFERNFQPPTGSSNDETPTTAGQKTYMDLTHSNVSAAGVGEEHISEIAAPEPQQQLHQKHTPVTTTTTRTHYQKTHKTERKRMKLRKHLSLDEETISPVSGTIIRKLRDDEELVVRKGDIDPAFNVVEITEESKAILASIDNKIGAYLCQLCRTLYDDAFMLAQHRCPRIVHIEYKCSECEKVFNCPANLASHRRWHKPKSELLANNQNKKRHSNEHTTNQSSTHEKSSNEDGGLDGIFPCPQCGKNFRRHAYLKKHEASHQLLENLKSLEIFKNSNASKPNFSHSMHQPHNHAMVFPNTVTPTATQPTSASHAAVYHHHPTTTNHHHHTLKPSAYQQRLGTFPFVPFDQRRFYSLGEFYLTQHLERSSAFQYVQHANHHLRNLTAAATSNLVPSRPAPAMVPPSLLSMSVK